MTLKVVNDSEHYVTFKKGSKIGHAESEIQMSNQETPEAFNVFHTASQPSSAEQNDTKVQDQPAHLRQMYSDNVSDLSNRQKSKFENLLSESPAVFFQRMILISVV